MVIKTLLDCQILWPWDQTTLFISQDAQPTTSSCSVYLESMAVVAPILCSYHAEQKGRIIVEKMVDGSNAALGGLQVGDVIRGTTARSKVFLFDHAPVTLLHAWLRRVPHSYRGFHAYAINVLQTAQSASIVDIGGTLASHIGRRERDAGWQWQQGQARLLGGTGAPQC